MPVKKFLLLLVLAAGLLWLVNHLLGLGWAAALPAIFVCVAAFIAFAISKFDEHGGWGK